jgi:hypothetical protein
MIDGTSLRGLKSATDIYCKYTILIWYFKNLNEKNHFKNFFSVFLKTWFSIRKIGITPSYLEL